ncbi:MAG: hypothetical protein KIS74_10175 [Burkholderiales bacterium]|nr:hypothetical protein [Burkholderiales bacterium]
MSFESCVKRVSQRDWALVKNAWLSYIPPLDDAGQPPDFDLRQFVGLEQAVRETPETGEYRTGLPGFRECVLHEAVFALHKASHVLGLAEHQATSGCPTWSLSTAYQSAFFAKEAVFRLLGIVLIEVSNRQVLVDVWPEPPRGLKGKALREYKLGEEIQLVQFPRLEHRHRWAIFKRALRVLENPPCNSELVRLLDEIDEKEFARQRNAIHYTAAWLFDDLFAFYLPNGFFRLSDSVGVIRRLNEEAEDFSLVLATTLVWLGKKLMGDIAQWSPIIENELQLLGETLCMARHPGWNESVLAYSWGA